MQELFNVILLQPTTNALLFFYVIFSKIGLPGAFGFSIVALTVLIRVLTHPFYSQQMMLARKMEEIKPKLDELTKKYEHDKKKLQEAQMNLYKEMGINPASGCFFTVLQIPVFFALYESIRLFVVTNGATKVSSKVLAFAYVPLLQVASIDPMFFGFNLFVEPSKFGQYGWFYLMIPVLTAVLQYAQISITMPQAKKKEVVVKKGDKMPEQDMSQMMNTQMKFIFPLMIGYFSYILPVGLAIYWNVFSLVSLLQHSRSKKK